MGRVEGKVAFVSGAARGQGVRVDALRGHRVVSCDAELRHAGGVMVRMGVNNLDISRSARSIWKLSGSSSHW